MDIENTTWTAVVERQAIFEALLANGEQHISQASHTPFASGPVADLLGPFEFNEYLQQILHGKFDINSITDDIQLQSIIKAMSHSDPNNPIMSDSKLMIEKLKQGFSYVKESTSSNPEGLHHGIWKSLIKDEDAFEPYALMIIFAFKYGEPPNVWTNSHQIILGKDKPSKPININQIRHIQLVCAAMNMGCHIIWGHEMLQRAVQQGLVSPYQFGGINVRIAISCVLLMRTSYDIIRLMRLTVIIFDNDVKAAYDCMIPLQCMILLARAGVKDLAIQMKLTALKWMKYFVKSAYGASKEYFTNTFLRSILGMLQGSSEVCPIWTSCSSVQFTVLNEQFPPAIFPSPCPEVYTARNGKGFVDDVSLWETSPTQELRVVQAQMQAKAQAWERGVHVAGGALNLLKTFFFAVSWNFQKNGQPIMRLINDDPDVTIQLTQGNDRTHTTPITRVEVHTGKQTLGVQLAPTGSDATEYQFHLQEASKL